MVSQEHSKAPNQNQSVRLSRWAIGLTVTLCMFIVVHLSATIWWAASITTSQENLRKDVDSISKKMEQIEVFDTKINVLKSRQSELERRIGVFENRFNSRFNGGS